MSRRGILHPMSQRVINSPLWEGHLLTIDSVHIITNNTNVYSTIN